MLDLDDVPFRVGYILELQLTDSGDIHMLDLTDSAPSVGYYVVGYTLDIIYHESDVREARRVRFDLRSLGRVLILVHLERGATTRQSQVHPPDVSTGYSGGPIEPIAGLISLGWNGFAAEHRLVKRGQPAPILGDDVYVCEASGHV